MAKTFTTRHFYFFFILLLLPSAVFAQNIGINSTGATPGSSSMLHIQDANKGLPLPGFSLTSTDDGAINTSPAETGSPALPAKKQ